MLNTDISSEKSDLIYPQVNQCLCAFSGAYQKRKYLHVKSDEVFNIKMLNTKNSIDRGIVNSVIVF